MMDYWKHDRIIERGEVDAELDEIAAKNDRKRRDQID